MPPRLERLRKRPDFLKAARAKKQVAQPFVLQARRRAQGELDGEAIRIGFTASRKIGKAVARNRAKRRLREAARLTVPRCGRAGFDYVLIARAAVLTCPFSDLLEDLERALVRIHGGPHGRRAWQRGDSGGSS